MLRCRWTAALTLVALPLGSARVDVRKVPARSAYEEWSDADQRRADATCGQRYYLPRPFLAVETPFCALSNNHVLARADAHAPGTTREQPSPAEPGDSRVVASLSGVVELDATGSNLFDAALARLAPGVAYAPQALDARVGVLHSADPLAPSPNDTVHKVGRTTGYSLGLAIDASATVAVGGYDLGAGSTLVFHDQLVIEGVGGPFAAEGDSGALVVQRAQQRGVGLLVGASQTTNVAVASSLRAVLAAFGAALIV